MARKSVHIPGILADQKEFEVIKGDEPLSRKEFIYGLIGGLRLKNGDRVEFVHGKDRKYGLFGVMRMGYYLDHDIDKITISNSACNNGGLGVDTSMGLEIRNYPIEKLSYLRKI